VRAPLGAKAAYGLAALTGFLYFLAFPGLDLWPFAFVALVPLIVALRGQTLRRAAGLGWTAGFVMTMTGFYWLLEMLEVFSGFPLPLCFLFMCILCAYQGGRIALAGYLAGRAERAGHPTAVVFPLAFVASELLFPLLFPWYYAATLHPVPTLLQTADLGGPYLLGGLLALMNVGVAELVEARLGKRSPSRKVLYAAAGALGFVLLYGLVRVPMVDSATAAAPPVRIGVIQANMPLFERKRAIPTNKELSKQAVANGAELLVWSEGAISQSFDEATFERDIPRAVSKDLGVPAILGGILRRTGERGADGKRRNTYFNTALFSDEKGEIHGRYDKQFLLAFGEYIPFGETFPELYDMSPNSGHFTPGTSIEPFVWGDRRISALICYEDIIPGFVGGIVRHANPDLLVNLTNDAWFGDSTEPWIHFALAKLRAVEHHRYLVRATNSGVSGIIDPVGRVVVHGGTFREESLVGDAHFLRATTGYGLWGDVPAWAAALVVVGLGFWRAKGAPPVAKKAEAPQKPAKAASEEPAPEAKDTPLADEAPRESEAKES
jgi:apolipoprotein N-acyltransferase